MPETEHVKVFKRGVTAWNKWRSQHRGVQPDLSFADLREASLRYANLNNANLKGANLEGANLGRAYLEAAELMGARPRGAHLFGADLGRADLTDADLSEAQLWHARLEEAKLPKANLSGADLRSSDLSRADLSGANLRGANLTGAFLAGTDLSGADLRDADLTSAQLWNCRLVGADLAAARMAHTALNHLDLSEVRRLTAVVHEEPSSVGVDTLEQTAAGLARHPQGRDEIVDFLRHAGVLESYLEVFSTLTEGSGERSTNFIRYSLADQAFARRLYDELQERGIRCWLHEHPMLPGDDVHEEVDLGVDDKLLLVGSEAAFTSWWIDREIERALAREDELTRLEGNDVTLLIPLALDGYLAAGRWQSAEEERLRSRLAADFAGWDDESATFERQLERLVEVLRA